MYKIAILYASLYHQNTYKLVKGISDKLNITLIDINEKQEVNLLQYDIIGFASGIDFGKFYSSVEGFLKDNLPKNKRVFFLYTCAKKNSKFTECVKKEALEKQEPFLI